MNYTYRHETLNQTSYIDYFMLSESVHSKVLDFDIVDSAINMSDHCQIMIKVNLSITSCYKFSDRPSIKKPIHYQLRWDQEPIHFGIMQILTFILI